MPTYEQTRNELWEMRERLTEPYEAAKAKSDTAEMERLTKLAGEIDDLLEDVILNRYRDFSIEVAGLRAKIEEATRRARNWPFNNEPSDTQERPFHEVEREPAGESNSRNRPTVPQGTSRGTTGAGAAASPNDYNSLWSSMTVLPSWKRQAEALARKIVENQRRYAAVVTGTNVPWWFVAVVHSMECSLRFDQHLHNGDSLTARTVRVPAGRPPAGLPPFTWEESAKDSISYEKLHEVTDWSVSGALYRWHRYNGIQNEYTRRGIPSPYLWSGSQHYVKGKYVRDGVFDPEAVSAQVGAAVILQSLIELRAVEIDENLALRGNPAAATEHTPSLVINTRSDGFSHVAKELDFPGILKKNMNMSAAQKRGTKRVQEWLNIHGLATPIDSDYGEATARQVAAFQSRLGAVATGVVDAELWAQLTAPMRRALAQPATTPHLSIEQTAIHIARRHIKEKPMEVGGNNHGPWVRLYMEGNEGEPQKWCAGFVSFIIAQASRDLGISPPFRRQVGVDALVKDAKDAGRFIGEDEVGNAMLRRSKIVQGMIFVVRQTATDWVHTGFVLSVDDQTFATIEGNTGGDGNNDGPSGRESSRSYPKKDFLRLV